jgi:peptidoglycan/LPS O-acetylase OafA/YrhL
MSFFTLVRVSLSSSLRLPWIDHLRTLMIVLVVNLHACVTYSHVGDWYLMSQHEPTLAAKVPFIIWEGHLQSFFMGLLFFVSAYFAHGSLGRRGPARFVRERLVRLGLPALFYMLVIHPFILLALNPWNANFGPPLAYYSNYLRSGRFLRSSGPLWFAVALLIFCLVFAGWRFALRRLARDFAAPASGEPQVTARHGAPSSAILGLFVLTLGAGSFAMRLVWPIGTSVLNLQLCYFVQYIAFFVAGLHAAHHGWLLPLAASRRARTAGWLALVGGPVLLLTLMVVGTRNATVDVFFGGWHWQAFGLALWEQLAGVGLSLGLLALFFAKFNFEGPWLRWLADRSFAVYVLHAPILVGLAMLFRALPQNMYGLAALLTLTGLVASYLVADVARRLPGLRAIL